VADGLGAAATGHFVSRNSGKCLDVPEASQRDSVQWCSTPANGIRRPVLPAPSRLHNPAPAPPRSRRSAQMPETSRHMSTMPEHCAKIDPKRGAARRGVAGVEEVG